MNAFDRLRLYGGMAIAGVALVAVFLCAHVYAGVLGIDARLGAGAALLAVLAAFFFRFTLPLSIGAFFGAMDVWGWHWLPSLLFALPGLLVLVPRKRFGVFMFSMEQKRSGARQEEQKEASFVRGTVMDAEIIEEEDIAGKK